MKKYIDAAKLYEHLEQVSGLYPSYADNIVDNAVSNVIDGIKTFINPLQQEQPEVDLKIEERKWVQDAVDNIFPEDGDFMSDVDFRKILKDTAHHFYELGLNARKEG